MTPPSPDNNTLKEDTDSVQKAVYLLPTVKITVFSCLVCGANARVLIQGKTKERLFTDDILFTNDIMYA